MANHNNGLSDLLDKLAKLVAVVVLFALAFRMVIAILGTFEIQIPVEILANIFSIIDDIILPNAALALAGLVGLEWGFKKGFLSTILVLVLLALCVIPQFFPDVWEQIMGTLSGLANA
ncbi:MAG: hypothetical protein J6R37_00460 [Clostridia bacterium]|nr:hypothetical protein [Clostridia bacterium]